MVFPESTTKKMIKAGIFSFAAFLTTASSVVSINANTVIEKKDGLGIIRGIVRDEAGKPISDAVVAIFRLGSNKILKQVRSSADGSFLTKLLPGKYTVLAVAQGFNPATLSQVEVGRASELNYGFNLERSGSGNTLPEKKADRKSSKWIIRAAQNQRSIYQINEGKPPVDENSTAEKVFTHEDIEENLGLEKDSADSPKRRVQSVAQTYFSDSTEGVYTGFNFATVQPVGKKTNILISAQMATKSFAPQRFEVALKTPVKENHRITAGTAVFKAGKVKGRQIGQISVRAFDEWQIRDGVILVLGFDYSRFIGAGNDSNLSPRFGLQFDANSKTRLKTSYTTQTEERNWSDAIELEGSQVLFNQEFEPRRIAVSDDKAVMNKSRRLDFGVERVLDNNSAIEGTVFFDSAAGRGVGLTQIQNTLSGSESTEPFTVMQNGSAQGARVIYTRRLNRVFSASAGYAVGKGQKLSRQKSINSGNIFENDIFQSFALQVNADLKTGTGVKTIFRLSPEATVFAIDPFQGKMAIYDPGLSVIITQALPNLGLPIRAEAVIDARNVLDYQTGNGEEGSLRLSLQPRMLRGGISVRF